MVYKRYIKINGKICGPYYYKSYRDKNGKVISKYLRDYRPPRRLNIKLNINKKILAISLIILIIFFMLIMGFLFYLFY